MDKEMVIDLVTEQMAAGRKESSSPQLDAICGRMCIIQG